jgi:patatin-related protein
MTGVNAQIRLALVLYGGISLAVYMNGMAQELLALVRASHARRMAELQPEHPFVREQRATNPYVRLLDAARVDVVIDVIAGTSAGGLNGLMLAKALAVGAPDLSCAADLWRKQAQLYKLGAYDREPVALLSGRFLHGALEQVFQHLSRSGDAALAEQVKVLDLFVTATDVRGHRWTFRDAFNQKVQGVAHKYLFHLRKRTCDPETGRSYDQNDFAHPDGERQGRIDRLLAKIGQATSALPAAFPPVRIGRAEAEEAGLPILGDVEAPAEGIWFSDGGVLMNRPFEPVVQTVVRRSASLPYKRVLAFLEAAPEPVAAPAQTEPSLLENALAGLTLTMQQDIADELERVARENEHRQALLRLAEEIDEAASHVGEWSLVEQAAREMLGQVAATGEETARVIPFPTPTGSHSPVLQSYYALRLSRLRELLRTAFDEALEGLGLPGAHREGVREALMAELPWLGPDAPAGDPQVAGLLARYDPEYHQRRLHFLLTRIQKRYRPGVVPASPGAMTRLLEGLWGALEDWRNAAWTIAHAGRLGPRPEPWGDAVRRLDQAFLALKQAAVGPGGGQALVGPGLREAAREAVGAIDGYLSLVAARTAAEVEGALAAAREALPLRHSRTGEPIWPPGSRAELTPERLARSYARFEARDLILFPLRTYGTTGEWETVELMRLSTDGAQGWVRRRKEEKLTGTKLGYFGAFLDERWRANDIMWGRLDAAELLTRLVVVESGLLKPGALLPPNGDPPPETDYADEARRALADRRRQIVGDFPELVSLDELRASIQQGGAALQPWEPLPDWALQRYLQERYRIAPEGVEGLPPQRLAAEVLIVLHNLVVALERSGGAMSGLHKVLLAVLRPLNWVARLILIPREGLLGVAQGNAAAVMTVIGTAILLLQLVGAAHLQGAGWGAVVALLAPAVLDALFRPTALRLAGSGALALLGCGSALARAELPGWLAWLEPLQQVLLATMPGWLARFAGAWLFFLGLFLALAIAYVAHRRDWERATP